MKRIPSILPRKEQSRDNATFTQPIPAKAKQLMRYLQSPDFERDFTRAMEEKAEAR